MPAAPIRCTRSSACQSGTLFQRIWLATIVWRLPWKRYDVGAASAARRPCRCQRRKKEGCTPRSASGKLRDSRSLGSHRMLTKPGLVRTIALARSVTTNKRARAKSIEDSRQEIQKPSRVRFGWPAEASDSGSQGLSPKLWAAVSTVVRESCKSRCKVTPSRQARCPRLLLASAPKTATVGSTCHHYGLVAS